MASEVLLIQPTDKTLNRLWYATQDDEEFKTKNNIMLTDKVVEFAGGLLFLLIGVCLLIYMVRETRKGYRSKYGNDIGLYSGSVFAILAGIVMIFDGLSIF